MEDVFLKKLYIDTEKCLGEHVARKLFKASSDALEDSHSLSDRIEVSFKYGGVVLSLHIPFSQLPEAWHNLLHIYCYHDYDTISSFTPKPGDIVLDAGAYLGFYTLYVLVKTGYKARVVAVEPNPLARKILYENLELNRAERNVSVDPRALSVQEGLITFYITPYWATSSTSLTYIEDMYGSSIGAETIELKTRSIRIPTLLSDHGIERFSLSKIDLESAESGVIADCIKLACSKRIVGELHITARTTGLNTLFRVLLSEKSTSVELVDKGLPNQVFLYVNTFIEATVRARERQKKNSLE